MFCRDPDTARMGVEILPLELGYLPPYFVKKAELELHETPSRRTQGLRQIKEALKKDKYTKNLEFDDDYVLQFLRARKFDVARAFSSLMAYVKLRRKNPGMYTDFSFEVTAIAMTDSVITVLPYRCQDGCTLFLAELDNWVPERFPVEELRKAIVILLLQSLRDPMTQVNGIKAIIDVKSNPIRHLKHCTPRNIYLIYHGIQECAPGRYKAVHIVNESLTFRAAWLMIKGFLSEKMKKRIHFHSSPGRLKEFFPSSVLPKKYGGGLEDYDMTHWLRKVMEPEKLATLGGCQFPPKDT